MSDIEIQARLTDTQALGLTMYGEASSEPVEGRIAVGCSVRNRRETHRRWQGQSYKAICLARRQYSCWSPLGGEGEAGNYARVMGRAERLVQGFDPGDAILQECLFLALGIIDHAIVDRIHRSTHYLTLALFKAAPPPWAVGQHPTVRIGAHVFFAGIA